MDQNPYPTLEAKTKSAKGAFINNMKDLNLPEAIDPPSSSQNQLLLIVILDDLEERIWGLRESRHLHIKQHSSWQPLPAPNVKMGKPADLTPTPPQLNLPNIIEHLQGEEQNQETFSLDS